MEPLRGGRLASLPAEDESRLKALRPEESVAAWSFRWLQNLPNVKMVLSGMSNVAQMQDNLSYMKDFKPHDEEEQKIIAEAQKIMSETYMANNGWGMFDPLDLAEKIKALDEQIDGFEKDVDIALSMSNAITTIEI